VALGEHKARNKKVLWTAHKGSRMDRKAAQRIRCASWTMMWSQRCHEHGALPARRRKQSAWELTSTWSLSNAHCLLHQQNPETKHRIQSTVPRGRPRRVWGRPAHKPQCTHTQSTIPGYYTTGLARATTQRQGHNGAGKRAQALTFRAFTPWLGYNTHQHHRLDSSRECTVCTGRDRAPAVR
jgi:hypothetical protein